MADSPPSGYEFSHWTKSGYGALLDGSSETAEYLVGSGGATLTAYFSEVLQSQSAVSISPPSVSLYAGESQAFTASGGSGTISYSWGGAASGSGASKTLQFGSAGSSGAGNYSVTVHNPANGNYTVSNTATSSVTVSDVPAVTLSSYNFPQNSLPTIHAASVPTGHYRLRAKIYHSGSGGAHTHAATSMNNHGASLNTLGSLAPGNYQAELYMIVYRNDHTGTTYTTYGVQQLHTITITAASSDSDGDGYSNTLETLLGTSSSTQNSNDSSNQNDLEIHRPAEQ